MLLLQDGLGWASETHLLQSLSTSALLGIISHMLILRLPYEFELVMYHCIASYMLVYIGVIFYLFTIGGYGISLSLFGATILATTFNAALLSSMIIYRVFLHRCKNFPGPFHAAITKFYALYQSAKKVQYYKEIEKMHEVYGDFVRLGPRQISITRKAAIPLIYGPQSECRKSSFYGNSGNDPTKVSINMTRDEASYKLRRRTWDRALSIKAINTYEPRIRAQVDSLIHQIRRHEGRPMDMTKWSMMLGFDLMGSVGFSKDFNNLVSGEEHAATQAIHKHMTHMGTIGETPWLLNILSSIPGAAAGFANFFTFCSREMEAKERTWDDEATPQDIASWLLKAVKDKDPSASPTKESLDDDSRVIIIAGSDTFANTVASVFYYLARDTRVQQKIQGLVDRALPDGSSTLSYDKIRRIGYIDDIIHEALRLKPPVVRMPARETPSKGLQIDEVFIPGTVEVSVPTITIMRDKRWWKHADEFIPERFGERRVEMGTDNAPYMPFGLGVHTCPGNNFAYASLRIVISSIAQNFDVAFAPGESGEAFDKEFLDTPLIKLLPVYLQFSARQQ